MGIGICEFVCAYRSFFIVAFLTYGAHLVYNNFYVPPPLPNIPADNYWGPGKAKPDDETIRPFKINIPDSVLDDLKKRLDLDLHIQPSLEGANFEYGFHSEQLKKVVQFWRSEYNWREREAKLNSLPQFKTQVNGLDLHFIHAKPKNVPSGVKVLPLLMLHGWPGSVKEFYDVIPILTTPSKDTDFVFEVVSPSLPGYAFSEASSKQGLGPAHIAAICRKLMLRLGYSKFYVQGGDWGAIIGTDLSSLYPENVLGLHVNMCGVTSPLANIYLFVASLWPSMFVEPDIEAAMFPLSDFFSNLVLEMGYMHLQATKPDTVGAALYNSPVGLAAYILEKFSTWTDPSHRQLPDGGLTRKFKLPDLLDNVMIYWVTGSISSSMRLYAECFAHKYYSQKWDSVLVKVPTVCAQFPHELMKSPDFILRLKYVNLLPAKLPTSDNDMYSAVRPARGGHFAAMEEPHLLAYSVFKSVEHIRQVASKKAK